MSERTTVVHLRREPYDVFIARPSKWGNPFRMVYAERKSALERDRAIQRYREWVVTQPHLVAALDDLRGKRLGCWCKPYPCHGDVLAELADDKTQERTP